ncbi:hypothetical protein CLF_106761 [Clonorchis sinensis]|uniref:Uncharacterized protein n=1 Tax=Clonorchis sinensis TaxID=79923 RepID=G7YQ63_CLOSI|nr:hypothetical protein CLF_106761 [Clonorchis sinensis]
MDRVYSIHGAQISSIPWIPDVHPKWNFGAFGTNMTKTRSGKSLHSLSNHELDDLLNSTISIFIDCSNSATQSPLYSPLKPNMAGNVRSRRHSGIDPGYHCTLPETSDKPSSTGDEYT